MENYNINSVPEYAEAYSKMVELQLKRDALRVEIAEVEGAIRPNGDPIRNEAEALLKGEAVATTTVTRNHLQQLRRDLQVVLEAIELQKQKLQSQKCAASAIIRDKARPAYQAIVKKTNAILESLREVAVEERQLRESLKAGEVSLTNEFVLPYHDCGDTAASGGVRQDSIARWQAEARREGMIK